MIPEHTPFPTSHSAHFTFPLRSSAFPSFKRAKTFPHRCKLKVDADLLLSVNTRHFCRVRGKQTRSQTVFGFGFQAGTIFFFRGGRFLGNGADLVGANSAY
jgi:hypothetical protein